MQKKSGSALALVTALTGAWLPAGCAPMEESDAEHEAYDSFADGGNKAAEDYRRCNATQMVLVRRAEARAKRMVRASVQHLSDRTNPVSVQLFKTWFDQSNSESRWATVRENMNALNEAFSNTITYYCDASERSTWGWTYGDPTKVYLGGVWLDAKAHPVDRATTIIHELSHAVLNTTHYPQAIRRLAQTAPDRAIDNAESYEYFCWKALQAR